MCFNPANAILNNNIVFENCISQNVSFPASPSNAAGFLASAVNGLQITKSQEPNASIGYLLAVNPSGGDVSNATVNDNEASNNSIAGFQNNALSINIFKENQASFNNGANYVNMPAGTPIVEWPLSAGKPIHHCNQSKWAKS